MLWPRQMWPVLVATALLAALGAVSAQNGYMGGRGMGMMMGGGMMGGGMMGGGGGGNGGFMTTIHSLLTSNRKISRTYVHTPSGIKSVTQSDDPKVAAWIKLHVEQMRALLAGCAAGACPAMPHAWDPVFAGVYSNADKIDLQVTQLPKGVAVEEAGRGAAAAALVQAHAAAVTGFVRFGMSEAMRAHPLPAAAKQAA